jgi:hypothetical protein
MSIEGNGTIHTIMVAKHLDSNTKHPKVLLWYDCVNRVTNEEEDMLLTAKSNLFTIGTITLLKLEVLVAMSNAKTSINTKTSIDVKNNIDAKIDIDVEIDMDTKTSIDLKFGNDEPIFDFPHILGKKSIDITLVYIKV